MALEIYMYNTWFGDCFRVGNGDSNLWIDFGIHQKAYIPSGLTRDDIHERIAVDVLASVNPSLVISHFHEDHISGLLYMMKKKSISKKSIFEKVFIPDIWNITNTPMLISVLLLEELLMKSKLSKRKGAMTLFDLIRFLCVSTANVVPIRRGSFFQGNSYIALWPEPDLVSEYANSYLNSLEVEVIPVPLLRLAVNLQNLVLEVLNHKNEYYKSEVILPRVDALESEFLNLEDNQQIKIILTKLSAKEDIYLNSLGNNISIVFQNAELVDGENILFTGDVENKFLNIIQNNADGKGEIYPYYDYIKIPHHGTKGAKFEHYFDFSTFKPKNYMIPSGCVTGVRGNWEICANYSNDIYLNTIKCFCSNSNFCESNSSKRFTTCSCVDRQFVFPNTFIKVK